MWDFFFFFVTFIFCEMVLRELISVFLKFYNHVQFKNKIRSKQIMLLL